MSRPLDLWKGLRPTRPPAQLRERVLGAARLASRRAPESSLSWVDRLADSEPLRLAWYVLVLVAVVGHLALDRGSSARGPRGAADLEGFRRVAAIDEAAR